MQWICRGLVFLLATFLLGWYNWANFITYGKHCIKRSCINCFRKQIMNLIIAFPFFQFPVRSTHYCKSPTEHYFPTDFHLPAAIGNKIHQKGIHPDKILRLLYKAAFKPKRLPYVRTNGMLPLAVSRRLSESTHWITPHSLSIWTHVALLSACARACKRCILCLNSTWLAPGCEAFSFRVSERGTAKDVNTSAGPLLMLLSEHGGRHRPEWVEYWFYRVRISLKVGRVCASLCRCPDAMGTTGRESNAFIGLFFFLIS